MAIGGGIRPILSPPSGRYCLSLCCSVAKAADISGEGTAVERKQSNKSKNLAAWCGEKNVSPKAKAAVLKPIMPAVSLYSR